MDYSTVVPVSLNREWEQVKFALRQSIGDAHFDAWFPSARLDEIKSNTTTVYISVANPHLVHRINTCYLEEIHSIWRQLRTDVVVNVFWRDPAQGKKIFDPEAHEHRRRKVDLFSFIPEDKTKRPPPAPKRREQPQEKPTATVDRTAVRPFAKQRQPAEISSPDKSSLEEAKIMVFNSLTKVEGRITLMLCQSFVMKAYGVGVDELESSSSRRHILVPRQVAIYLCKKLTPFSQPEIGKHFGGRDRLVVATAIRRVESLCSSDKDFNDLITSYIDHFETCLEFSKRSIVEAP